MAETKCTLSLDVFKFPDEWDNYWRPYDDPLIQFIQSTFPTSGHHSCISWALFTLSKFCSVIFSIEFISAITFALYATGYDSTADPYLVLSIVSSITTQIPKRFAYRIRPFAAEPPRAKGVRAN